MRPYYSIKDMDEYGPMVFLNDEKYYVKVKKDKPGERFRYKQMIKDPDRHLFNKIKVTQACGRKQVHTQGR